MVHFQRDLRGSLLCAAVAKIISDEIIASETHLESFPEISVDRNDQDNLEFTLVSQKRRTTFFITQKQALDLQRAVLAKNEYPLKIKEFIINEFFKL